MEDTSTVDNILLFSNILSGPNCIPNCSIKILNGSTKILEWTCGQLNSITTYEIVIIIKESNIKIPKENFLFKNLYITTNKKSGTRIEKNWILTPNPSPINKLA